MGNSFHKVRQRYQFLIVRSCMEMRFLKALGSGTRYSSQVSSAFRYELYSTVSGTKEEVFRWVSAIIEERIQRAGGGAWAS